MAKIYVYSPRWFLRPRNTDWRYARFTIPRIGEFVPSCGFFVARSLPTTARSNFSYVTGTLRRLLGMPSRRGNGVVLDLGEFRSSGCNAVFCHDDFPRNAGSIPVIWQNSILDPEMMLARGFSVEAIERLREEKAAGFRQATVVQVASEAEKARLGQWFPEIAERFVAIPFLLPDVRAISAEGLKAKLEREGPLRFLFVGHEARRKGLARVYDALKLLDESVRRRLHLTVVSAQTDGSIPPPPFENLRILSGLPHGEVLELMRASDVFVMPSIFESYGLAYVEAMAQGTIPVAPNWEVQREIVAYGQAGVVTSGDPADLAAWMERLCEDRPFRIGLALAARRRFETHYAPQVVADRFASVAARSFS